jgi:hypothetical protein
MDGFYFFPPHNLEVSQLTVHDLVSIFSSVYIYKEKSMHPINLRSTDKYL